MEDINTRDLIEVIHEYMKSNYSYDYEYADVFDDSITYHLGNNKVIYIELSIDLDDEEDD